MQCFLLTTAVWNEPGGTSFAAACEKKFWSLSFGSFDMFYLHLFAHFYILFKFQTIMLVVRSQVNYKNELARFSCVESNLSPL